MLEINKIYRLKSSEFSMRRRVKVLSIGETHVFVRIIQPECWDLINKETVLKLETLIKEYK